MDRTDVEMGEETLDVERRPRAGVVVSVRLSPQEADRLQDVAERRRLTISQVAREALSAYLTGGAVGALAAAPLQGGTSNDASLTLIVKDYGHTAYSHGPVKEPTRHAAAV